MQDELLVKVEPGVDVSSTRPNMALEHLGQELNSTLDALADLRNRGITHVVNSPELVFVGDQSSGKSSLMSAIAGISPRRRSPATTRCPLHIRVSTAPESPCRVYLGKDYEYLPPIAGDSIANDNVRMGNNKYPPWKALPPHRQARLGFKTVPHRHVPSLSPGEVRL